MKKFSASYIALVLSSITLLPAQTVQTSLPSANGNVLAIRTSGSTIYLGGSFTYLGRPYGHAVMSNTSTSNVNTSFPIVGTETSDDVKAIVSDGSGGYYIAGSFTSVGGSTRNNIARINSDGTLNSWNAGANCNGAIKSIAVSADFSTVYVGGDFTTIGQSSSSSRNRIAALSASTGNATSWDPNSNGSVNSLVLSASSTIYVGGSFTSIGGQTRNYIAEINTGSNTATTWNPNANNSVNVILLSGSNLYVGGTFTSIGGNTRNYLARVPNNSNTSDSWNPNADNTIYALAISGSNVFVGGSFSSIGGVTISALAVLDANTNTNMANSSWTSSISINSGTPSVRGLTVDGTNLYVAGEFSSIGSTTKNNVAGVNISSLTSFTLGSFSTTTGSLANVAFVSSTNIYIGGSFYVSAGSTRNNIASINGSTGEINSWNPNANNQVNDIIISSDGNTAYVSGNFTSIGGQSRNRLAKLSTSSGNADATWNPNADAGVEKMSLNSTETTLFFYGGFSNINGSTARSSVAAVSTSGAGTATAFTFTGLPDITTRLISVAPGDSIVYFGYNSTGVNINSTSRNYFCAVRASDGSLTNWNPLFNQAPFAVAYVGSTMYIGGQFTSVGGDASYQRIAKFSGSGGWHEPVQDFTWNVSSASRPNGEIRAIIYTATGSSPLLYLAGSFSSIGATARQTYAAIKASDMTLMTWNITCDNNGTLNTRLAVSTTNQKIYIADASNTLFNSTRAYKFLGVSGDASDPLPIKLLNFQGELNDNHVDLNWTTASEINANHFEVEKFDEFTKEFKSIGSVNCVSNSHEINNYSFTDYISAIQPNYYYRLKQIDNDGYYENSNTICISTKLNNASIDIFPNPNSGKFYIQYSNINPLSHIVIYDIMGKKVVEKSLVMEFNVEEFELAKGIYTICVVSNNSRISKRVLIQD